MFKEITKSFANEFILAKYARFQTDVSGGWPSLTGVNVKTFLGQSPTNKRVEQPHLTGPW
ncbi:MAG: hypothetical protein EBV97_16915 [Rhodobacteraceae bacterium]|nr:hypothetical protein [Paracoccaceae bacterium]